MPSKVVIEVMEHHAIAGKASLEVGDEKAAATLALERNKRVLREFGTKYNLALCSMPYS